MPKDETLVVIAMRTRRTTVQALCILQYVEVMVASYSRSIAKLSNFSAVGRTTLGLLGLTQCILGNCVDIFCLRRGKAVLQGKRRMHICKLKVDGK